MIKNHTYQCKKKTNGEQQKNIQKRQKTDSQQDNRENSEIWFTKSKFFMFISVKVTEVTLSITLYKFGKKMTEMQSKIFL